MWMRQVWPVAKPQGRSRTQLWDAGKCMVGATLPIGAAPLTGRKYPGCLFGEVPVHVSKGK